jgi:hypothetical protein
MNFTSRFPQILSRHTTTPRAVASALLLLTLSSAAFAQNNAAPDAERRRRGNGDENGGRRGNFNPEDMQARLLSSLRERLEVTDDEEWKLISDRIAKVNELRRNSVGGGAMMAFIGRGGAQGGDSNRGGDRGRSGRGSSTEMAALQSAIRDKLPDAEIKSRLDRVREMRKDNEAKLSKAQEELRAVLTVRQEAVAVMFGLLP